MRVLTEENPIKCEGGTNYILSTNSEEVFCSLSVMFTSQRKFISLSLTIGRNQPYLQVQAARPWNSDRLLFLSPSIEPFTLDSAIETALDLSAIGNREVVVRSAKGCCSSVIALGYIGIEVLLMKLVLVLPLGLIVPSTKYDLRPSLVKS